MSEITNVDRAKWAMASVQTFADITGNVKGIDFSERLENARMHYQAESVEG